jgi:hypothetical protein
MRPNHLAASLCCPAGARGAAIGKGAAIVDEQQRPAMAMSRCRLVLPVCVASAG